MTHEILPDPGSGTSKSRQVREMFSRIAPTYDLLNRLLSFGIDQTWRAHAVKRIPLEGEVRVLDLCGGTGDFALQFLKRNPSAVIHLADFAYPMLGRARTRLGRNGSSDHGILCGDALSLSFRDEAFDATLCAFGVRNWASISEGLDEVERVLKPGGYFAVLEFFQAGGGIGDQLGRFYSRKVLPTVGKWISGHRRAYTYLAESMDEFYSADSFQHEVEACGFETTRVKRFPLGLCWFFLFRKTG